MSDFSYIPLRLFTTYSLAEGAIKCEEAVDLCKRHRIPAIGITERHNLFSSLEMSQLLQKAGIQPIIGTTIALLRPASQKDIEKNENADYDALVLFAKNQLGYQNLLLLSSLSFEPTMEGHPAHITFAQLERYAQGLICLTAGNEGAIIKLLAEHHAKEAEMYLQKLRGIFPGHLYIEISRHGLPSEIATEPALLALATTHAVPVVATNRIFFSQPEMVDAHDALLCIAEGTYIDVDERRRSCINYYFKTPREMEKLFADLPQALQNTVAIAKRCAVMAETRQPMLPRFQSEDETESEEALLTRLAEEGLNARLTIMNHAGNEALSEAEQEARKKVYFDRLYYELNVINSMKFPGYFLIVSDFIRYSKRQGIPVGPGRGSGAGSVVAWSLEITDLDPIRFGLLFERFLNPERVSMPDFDIDFCQYRRDEVINYVQQKYGQDRVAQIITFGKLQARAVLRDVGRVLQMPYGQVDRICKLVPNNPANPTTLDQALEIEPALKEAFKTDPSVKRLITIAMQLEGLNRHASTHAAGVVIADSPIPEIVPLYRDGKSTMPVLQYSMKYAEAAGLIKFDFLGLKTLTMIDQCCQLIHNGGTSIDMATLSLTDGPTYSMLRRGEAIGVFQFEGKGMRDTLKKLQPDCIEDLIALGALYRPGPMDNIPRYIACKHGKEKPDMLHPLLEPVLKETFGVIIYQEQVMQIAQTLSGYSLGSADLLRRAMGKKIKSEMDAQREIFISGAIKNNVSPEQAGSIFDLVDKFAGYGFNKSHAAAYAIISYQTAYLRANFPVEFLVSSMNLELHDTDKIAIFAQEARAMGVPIFPPDVQHSMALFSVAYEYQNKNDTEKGARIKGVRYGLGALKGVGLAATQLLVEEREQNGPYRDFYQFMERAGQKFLNKRQLEQLIKAGACDSLHSNRNTMLSNLELLMRVAQAENRSQQSKQIGLFAPLTHTPPQTILKECEPWDAQQALLYESEAIGFYLSGHPLHYYHSVFAQLGVKTYAFLKENEDNAPSQITMGVVPLDLRIRTSQKGRFGFLQVSDSSETFDIAIFQESLLGETRKLMDTNQPLIIQASIRSDAEGGMRIIMNNMQTVEDFCKEQLRKVQLHVRDAAALDWLYSLCQEKTQDGLLTELFIHIPSQGRVTLRLPYRLSFEHYMQCVEYGLV